jgi:hypothetical protein
MDIVARCNNEKMRAPRFYDVAICPFLPLWNGILEFKNDGSYIFHENNYHIFLNGFTNIIYDPNYETRILTDEKKKYYRNKAESIKRSIYPENDEYEYMMTLLSSVLVGDVQKDLFVELYGLGGDGKTTICNLIMSMLGSSDFGHEIQFLNDEGKLECICNPNGLACTMQTFAILYKAKDSHNEGGLINLPGKRFCSMQEPDVRISSNQLNCSVIKELTGGTTMTARGIYKSATTFKPNCLFVLQTNKIFGYSEDGTDAMQRRMCIVKHKAKFYTERTKERLQNLQYSHPVNPKIGEMIRSDPMLWQAFFYLLLPYTKKINKQPVSNIKMPESIVLAIEESFNDIGSINGFFNSNIRKCIHKVVSFYTLLEMIVKENDKEGQKGYLLSAVRNDIKRREASQKIFNKYTGYIYKLNKNYLKNPSNEAFGARDDITEEFLNTTGETVHSYFNQLALNNVTTMNSKIVYILDHELKTPDEND